MSDDRQRAIDVCSGCGWIVPGGTEGCQRVADELWARDFGWPAYFRSHRMAVDAYCLQHPDRYCASGRSLAAHLGGLCCAFEEEDVARALRDLQRWLGTRPGIVKPPIPASRAALTIASVRDTEGAVYHQAVERWARATWVAYAALHEAARGWVELSRGTPRPARRKRVASSVHPGTGR